MVNDRLIGGFVAKILWLHTGQVCTTAHIAQRYRGQMRSNASRLTLRHRAPVTGKRTQLRARKLSNASLKAAGSWSGEPCLAFAKVINCEPGLQRCAASDSTLKNGRVNSPLVIVTGTLS